MRILTMALGVPFPPLGGGLTRTFHLLRSLAAHHELVLAAFTYGERHADPPFPVQVKMVPWRWSQDYQEMIGDDAVAARRAFEKLAYESDDPWFVSAADPTLMEEALRAALRTPVDLVLLEGTPLARFRHVLPRGIPRVLDLLDVQSLIARRAAQAGGANGADGRQREAQRTLAFERAAAQSCDLCLAVSDAEASAARELLGIDQMYVVPNGVDTSFFTPSAAEPASASLLFTGRMSYEPNADAVSHFTEDILP
ncbi:MAG: glycosyltransferase, partial [Luteitalea sp.]|nr:glycosyltransferase [Luteitalea sp.]